jgi:DNA polymerase III sliding clamp (beta) subunit (PCNA family)
MNFTIETGELQRIIKILGHVARNASDRTGKISIIATDSDKVVFLASRDDVGIQVTSNKVSITEQGSVTVFYNSIKSFVYPFVPWINEDGYGTKEFRFVLNENDFYIYAHTVHENGKKSNGKLKLDIDLVYSVVPPDPFNNADFILNSNIIRDAVDKVLYAINPTEQRIHIKGMNMRFDDKYIYFAGTNGKMLSEYKVNNVSTLKKGEFMVSYDFINILKSLIVDNMQLFFEFEANKKYSPKIKVLFDDVYYWGKQLIGSEFPEYNSLLENFSNTVIVKKSVIMGMLIPLLDVLDSDDYNRLTLNLNNDSILLYSDYGDFEYDVDVDNDVRRNEVFSIDINGQFLKQTVEAIKDDTVIIKFFDDKSSLLFDSYNFENQRALITPIRKR